MSSLTSRMRLVQLGGSDEYGPQQLGLMLVVALAPVAFFACAVLAGAPVSWWWLILAPVTFLAVPNAESTAHLVLWALLLVIWALGVPGPVTWWAVPAAMVVAGSHASLTLLAGRPASGDLASDTLRRVGRRLGVVGGVVTGVAVLAQVIRSVEVRGQVAPAVIALVLVAAWIWWGGRRSGDEDAR